MFKIFITSIFAALISQAAAQDFVVGTTSGYAPYVSLNEKGEYVGFDIDIAKELSLKLGRTLVLKDLGSMPALMLGLAQGKVDALIWAISITDARQKQMEMIYYQGDKVTSMPLLFWQKIPENIRSLKDLADNPKATICVEAGSFQEALLQKTPGLNLKSIDKVQDAILELRFGKSLATMVDPSILAKLKSQCPELQVLDIALAPDDQSLGNGIALSKKESLLATQVRQAIDELQKSGKIKELESKWNLGE